MSEFSIVLASEKETLKRAKLFAKELMERLGPCWIALKGELGMGKTTFVRGFVKGLQGGEKIRVLSPSYTLVRTYETLPPVHHVDLYRLQEGDTLRDTGLEYLLDDKEAFVLVEWAERCKEVEQQVSCRITLQPSSGAGGRLLVGEYLKQ